MNSNTNNNANNSIDNTSQYNQQNDYELKHDDTQNQQQYNPNYDYNYNHHQEQDYNHYQHGQYQGYDEYYGYNDYEYEEDQYEDEIGGYDECDWDPKTNKMRINTFKSEKKPKQKKDPIIKSHQNTMKTIHRINQFNHYSHKRYSGDRNLYGIIIINAKELYIGTICNNYTTELYSKSSGFQSGKHNKGGQSAQRFGRIYDNKINAWIKECSMKINKIFDTNSIIKTHGIILAGNGNIKDKLYQSKFVKDEVKNLILKQVNTKYGGKSGFTEIFGKLKTKQLFQGRKGSMDDDIIQEVMKLAIDTTKCDMISIGVMETIKAMKLNIIKYIVLAHDAFKYVIKKKTKPVRFIRTEIELHECIKEMNIQIGKTWKIVGFMEYMKNLCRINNVEVKIVSGESDIAQQFVNEYSGCIGVLHQSFDYLNDE